MTAGLTDPPVDAGDVDSEGTRAGRWGTVGALACWSVLVVASRVWGLAVVRDAPEPLFVDAVPFYGVWRAELTWRLALAGSVVAAVVVGLPRLADRTSWRRLLVAVGVSAVAVGLALAHVEPSDEAWGNIHGDYGAFTHLVDEQGPGGFLRDYAERQVSYPTHLSAHPPGMVLLLWAEGRLGLDSTGAEVGTAMAGVLVAAVAALVALRELAGERLARIAAPFVVVAPAAVWHTNADVVMGGIGLGGLALLALGTGAGRRAGASSVAGGALLGGAMLFSHGLVLLAVPAGLLVLHRRAWRAGLLGGAGALAVVGLPLAWGYSWLAGLESTKVAYDANLARVRPYGYFVVANLAAFAVAVGPAIAVALTRLRGRGAWVLVGGGLGAVALADLSGLSLAETERIWQPFMPLVLLAGGALAATRATAARRWLVLQAVTTLVLVAFLRSPW